MRGLGGKERFAKKKRALNLKKVAPTDLGQNRMDGVTKLRGEPENRSRKKSGEGYGICMFSKQPMRKRWERWGEGDKKRYIEAKGV